MAGTGQPFIDRLKEQFSVTSYADYQKNMAKRRVVNELSKLIINQPVETDSDSSSNLFKILVKRFKTQLSRTEKDPNVCDTAARKLAKFVESVMREAYFTQKYRKRSSVRSHSAVPSARESSSGRFRRQDTAKGSRESAFEKDTIIKGLGFTDTSSNLPVSIEKVPRSFARNVTKCGPLYTANLGGRKVYVQEVKEGQTKKALISRVNSESTDPNREWSSWMVDLANKTKEWINWLDNKASLVDKKSSSSLQDPACSWITLNERPLSVISESPERTGKIYQRGWRELSDDSCLSKLSSRTSSDQRRPMTGNGEEAREWRREPDFHVGPTASNSNNYTFYSSFRTSQRPPGTA